MGRRRHVLIRRREYVPLRRLGDVPLRRLWMFIWDLFEKSWRRTDEMLSIRFLEKSSWHTNKTSWRRTTETSWRRFSESSLGVSFETSLGHTERRRYDVAVTSCCRVGRLWTILFLEASQTATRIGIHHKRLWWSNLLIHTHNYFQ